MGGQGRYAKSSIIEHRLEIWCTGSSFATIYLECEESWLLSSIINKET